MVGALQWLSNIGGNLGRKVSYGGVKHGLRKRVTEHRVGKGEERD